MRQLALVALSLALALPARAQPSPEEGEPHAACFDAFSDAQRLRREGQLLDSREALRHCAGAPCPTAILDKCVEWLGEVEADIPSFVVSAKDRTGEDTSKAKVWLDGELVAETLDGRPIEADPGPHELVVEHGGERRSEHPVLVAGEKNRRIELRFAPEVPPPAPAEPEPSAPQPPDDPGFHISPLVWVGAAVAAAGAAVGAVTGGLALARADDLDSRCPNGTCGDAEKADLNEGTQLAHASTASFVIAGAGVALGVVGLVVSGPEERETVSLVLSPSSLTLRGRF